MGGLSTGGPRLEAAGPVSHRSLRECAGFRLNALSREIVENRLRSSNTHNARREEILKKLFEEAGCEGQSLTEHPVEHVKTPNLVCVHAGKSPSTIVVGAHYDMVEMGEGVVDNWSGASLLPSLLQGLGPAKHTFWFVSFTGEERGLLGSKALVREIERNGAKEQIRAMVNLDTLGLTDSEVWASRADPELVRWLGVTAASMKLPVSKVNVEEVGSSDSEPFREKKIPAITIHSLTQQTLRVLHSPRDTIKQIDMDAYYRTYQLVLGYLTVLDMKLD
jgi:Iap family predicted aminopeptidase